MTALWAPTDRRPIWQWAADHVEIPPTLTKHGRFNPSRSRHFLPVFDALQSESIRTVALYKPVRGGGTLISDIWHLWTRAIDPGPAMAILQTDPMAADHMEKRLRWMFDHCPPIKPLMPDKVTGKRGMEILFRDGIPLYISGPGENKLQTRGIRYISLDELHLMKRPGILSDAQGRQGDFVRLGNHKMLLTTQGGIEDDHFDQVWQSGTQSVWTIHCLNKTCGHRFVPQWGEERPDGSLWGMRWDDYRDKDGLWQVGRCLPTVRYECPACGYPHYDTPAVKEAWDREGCYTNLNPHPTADVASFRWCALIADPWRMLVDIYLQSQNARKTNDIRPLIQFFQKRMAEPYSERKVLEGQKIRFAREYFGLQPGDIEDEHMRVLTADRQAEDMFWVLIGSWTKDGKFRRLWFGQVHGKTSLKEKAKEWKVHNVGVDARYQTRRDSGVYAICCEYHNTDGQSWIALLGDKCERYWHKLGPNDRVERTYSEVIAGDPELGKRGEGDREANAIRYHAHTYTERMDRMIAMGRWIEPQSANEDDAMEIEYRKQMASEFKRKEPDRETAGWKWVYVCPSGNNHARDCGKMQVLLATMGEILPDIDVGRDVESAAVVEGGEQ